MNSRKKMVIIRVESGLSREDIPDEVKQTILNEFGLNSFQLEQTQQSIDEDENYAKCYSDRINEINDGVRFFIDALPNLSDDVKDKLKEFLKNASDDCINFLKNLPNPQKYDIGYYQNSLANYSKYIMRFLSAELGMKQSDVRHQLERAEEFALALKKKDPICTIKRVEGTVDEFIVMIDQPINPIGPTDSLILNDLRNIQDDTEEPRWFAPLKDFEKDYIRILLKDKNLEEDLSKVISALSSKLRIIPIPANYAKHTLITYMRKSSEGQGDKPRLKVHPSEIRSSHAASRDVKSNNKYLRNSHARRNLRKMMKDALNDKINQLRLQIKNGEIVPPVDINIPVLYQTLITPFKSPDYQLNQDKKRAVEAIQRELQTPGRSLNNLIASFQEETGVTIRCKIYSTNHPLNYGKYVAPTTPGVSTGMEVEALVDAAQQSPKYREDGSLLQLATNSLRHRTAKVTDIFESYRELYLSSLEQLVTAELNGISIGSCVSGKDRKAVEIAHTDAMKVFFEKYGTLPPMIPNKSNQHHMDNFAKIFAQIYCSKHQQALAGQNAPGSFGTKTPEMYLPDHLINAVHDWYNKKSRDAKNGNAPVIYKHMATKNTLKESDIMASNNEIHKIKPMKIAHKNNALIWTPLRSNQLRKGFISKIDDNFFNQAFNKARDGILNVYLPTGKSRMGLSAKLFGWKSRVNNANYIMNILNECADRNSLEKSIILFAILTTHKGKTLQHDISHALGFATAEQARKSIAKYIRDTIRKQNNLELREIRNTVSKVIANISHSKNRNTNELNSILDSLNEPTVKRNVISRYA